MKETATATTKKTAMTLDELRALWAKLEDVPVVETENGDVVIDCDFDRWKKGTSRDDIWMWFDEQCPHGFVRNLVWGLNLPVMKLPKNPVKLAHRKVTSYQIWKAERVLSDNGIESDEVDTVLQAIGYVLLDTELYPEEDKR